MSADYPLHPTPTSSPPIQMTGSRGSSFPDFPTTYGKEQLVGKLARLCVLAVCLSTKLSVALSVCLSVCHAFSFVAVAVFAFAQVRARPSGAPVCSPPPPSSCARVIGACVVGDGPR